MYDKKKQSKNVKKNRAWGAKTITKYENLLFMEESDLKSDMSCPVRNSSWGVWKKKVRTGPYKRKAGMYSSVL
jgi:hypothetical protein